MGMTVKSVAGAAAERAWVAEDWLSAGFGLYLHWPFCASKCPYCDFNSHVAARIDQRRWQEAYRAELRRVAALTQGRVLNTVFFGGGTPSLMDPGVVAEVLAEVRACWPLANDLEVTLEANPGSVEAARFAGYREAGVNRISMGVQALEDADLRRLGRLHDAAEARAAFGVARALFDRVSFDLIYARQDQTLAAWRDELAQALDMAVDHLSLYQLTVEDGTAFGARAAAGKLAGLPEEGLAAEMYAATQEQCVAAGMPGYEISNHARPGAESRHNLIYWRSGDWAGIGPGAHGRLTLGGRRLATETALSPGEWLARVERQGSGETGSTLLEREEPGEEALMMGLRLSEGVETDRLARLGLEIDPHVIKELAEDGLLFHDAGRIVATQRGRLLLNAVLRRLLGA
jgi:oxygen-independent coproporphyrinogen-3 oxidase